MKKIKSITKKVANINVFGYVEGRKNFKLGKNQELAEARSKICAGCSMNQEEPIDELRVPDNIVEISNRYCDACGCSLPFLLRQNRKKCKLGKW